LNSNFHFYVIKTILYLLFLSFELLSITFQQAYISFIFLSILDVFIATRISMETMVSNKLMIIHPLLGLLQCPSYTLYDYLILLIGFSELALFLWLEMCSFICAKLYIMLETLIVTVIFWMWSTVISQYDISDGKHAVVQYNN